MVKTKLKVKLSEVMLDNLVMANKSNLRNVEKTVTINIKKEKVQDEFEAEL